MHVSERESMMYRRFGLNIINLLFTSEVSIGYMHYGRKDGDWSLVSHPNSLAHGTLIVNPH